MRVTRDIDIAEECVQDAYAQALRVWAERGIPRNPAAWLTTTARNRALDLLRRETRLRQLLPLVMEDDARPEPEYDIPDDRLRLICTCCHPALAPEARVALTLRLLCGLTTVEVARSFLVSESTMAARITRAKKKIATARIPYRVPSAAELPARIDGVLEVVHLVFTAGHTAPVGDGLRRGDLVERSLDLARLLRTLLPTDPQVAALLALILLTDARRATRTDATGALVLLADQDRTAWDAAEIDEGLGLVREALRARPPSRLALQAAIAAVHAEAPSWAATDWAQLVGLYDVLLHTWPSPVVALNRAVAVGFADGPQAGLAALDELAAEPQLAGYAYLSAARADLLRRLDRRCRGTAGVRRGVAPDRERGGAAFPARSDCHTGAMTRVEPMTPADWPRVRDIYAAGIASGDATFEREPADWPAWNAAHLPDHRFVARTDDVIGWAAAAPASDRTVYAGVVESSVYVDPGAARRGAGRALLAALVASTEAAGIWTIRAGIFPENGASLALHEALGFRRVGVHERIGCQDGRWRDVVLLERRSTVTGCG